MAQNSKIEWTEVTWNPLAGCTAKSPGCLNCYAATMSGRLDAMGQAKYTGTTVKKGGRRVFNGLINYNENALLEPLRRKKPTTYFVNSMSDLFWGDEEDLETARRLGVVEPKPVPFEFIDRVFAVMALCSQHTFQVLTKREHRMESYTTDQLTPGRIACLAQSFRKELNITFPDAEFKTEPLGYGDPGAPWYPLKNVWLGVSVENQKYADERLSHLCKLGEQGWNTMVSAEPLLGSIILPERYLALGQRTWMVTGGESGSKARPMHPDWVRSIRDQCVAVGVPFFFKQGSQANWANFKDFDKFSPEFQIREFPK